MTDIQLLQQLSFTMLTDYCDRVHQIHSNPSVSSVTARCIDYISVHLHEPMTLEQISEHCGLCTRSLSLRFKKEIGMGIPEYINREKIKEAEYLLRYTDYALAEISVFLNYPSQSHFTQVFKKYTQTTPRQFREKC